jgi:hypothetical protein
MVVKLGAVNFRQKIVEVYDDDVFIDGMMVFECIIKY